jgi:hypothetical protein
LKWLVLQCLTMLAKPKLRAADVGTNGSFAGVLFTGRMTGEALECCWHTNHCQNASEDGSRAMLLIHPAQPVAAMLCKNTNSLNHSRSSHHHSDSENGKR